jgi:peptidoglycan hydrolase CwlO-like protein
MSGIEYYATSHELEWVQEQIYNLVSQVRELENKVDQLQEENKLLRHDLNTIENNTTERK